MTYEIFMQVPDEQGVRKRTPVKVKANNPTESLEKNMWSNVQESSWALRFSTVLPKYIHSFLLGKKYDDGSLGRGKKDYTDFKKTVSAHNMEHLTKELNHIYKVYVHLYRLHHSPRNKRIWIGFDLSPLCEVTSSWNSAQAGFRMSTTLAYFVGFQGGSKIWDLEGKHLHESYDKEVYNARSIEWSQEREDTIRDFADKLDSINGNLAKFILQMDDNNFEGLMAGNDLLRISS